MKTFKKIILASIVLLLTMSCKKETLTSATQIGANTFSCKINGVIRIPNNEAFGPKAVSISLTQNYEDIRFFNLTILSNYSKKEPGEKVNIKLYKINNIGKYSLSDSEARYGEYSLLIADPIGGLKYDSRTFDIGEVNITKFDTVGRIISGTFWFEATNKNNSSNKILITAGRFDLKF